MPNRGIKTFASPSSPLNSFWTYVGSKCQILEICSIFFLNDYFISGPKPIIFFLFRGPERRLWLITETRTSTLQRYSVSYWTEVVTGVGNVGAAHTWAFQVWAIMFLFSYFNYDPYLYSRILNKYSFSWTQSDFQYFLNLFKQTI